MREPRPQEQEKERDSAKMQHQVPSYISGKRVWKPGGGHAASEGTTETLRLELWGGRLQLKPQRPYPPTRKGLSMGTECSLCPGGVWGTGLGGGELEVEKLLTISPKPSCASTSFRGLAVNTKLTR